MLKKIFYFGVGLTSVFCEKFDRLAQAGQEKYNELFRVNFPDEEIVVIETVVPPEEETLAVPAVVMTLQEDDLTAINGIGPTFAARLKQAGITTYDALAHLNEEQVREITHVAEWQANPGEWIASAEAMT